LADEGSTFVSLGPIASKQIEAEHADRFRRSGVFFLKVSARPSSTSCSLTWKRVRLAV
jgi:hypothetical protein